MSEVKVNPDHPDAASGSGTYGVSDRFFERSNVRGRTKPNRIVTRCTIQIPHDVDHWREERHGDDYGLSNEREYAMSLAMRWFKETYGYSPSAVYTDVYMQEFRDDGLRPSDGFRSGFHVWIDTNPDHDPEIPESAEQVK